MDSGIIFTWLHMPQKVKNRCNTLFHLIPTIKFINTYIFSIAELINKNIPNFALHL